MIKFFRHIRKSLINQNQMGKYLKYAVGEIILVMVGILLALQVNNWNETMKERQQENTILQSLKTEFETNKKALQGAINRSERRKTLLKQAFDYTGKDVSKLSKVKSDSILLVFASYISAETQFSILNDLLSAGNIHILQNDELKKLLNNWTITYADEVLEIERRMLNETDRTFRPFVTKHVKAISEHVKERHGITSGFEEDYKTIYSLQEFEALCSQKMDFYWGAITSYEDMIEHCNKILNRIDQEFNKK